MVALVQHMARTSVVGSSHAGYAKGQMHCIQLQCLRCRKVIYHKLRQRVQLLKKGRNTYHSCSALAMRCQSRVEEHPVRFLSPWNLLVSLMPYSQFSFQRVGITVGHQTSVIFSWSGASCFGDPAGGICTVPKCIL